MGQVTSKASSTATDVSARGRLAHRMFDLVEPIGVIPYSADEPNEEMFTPTGRRVKDRVEALTDELAAAPYDVLGAAGLDELMTHLEPVAQRLTGCEDER